MLNSGILLSQPLGKKEIILNNQDVLYFEGDLVLDQIIGSFNKPRI